MKPLDQVLQQCPYCGESLFTFIGAFSEEVESITDGFTVHRRRIPDYHKCAYCGYQESCNEEPK